MRSVFRILLALSISFGTASLAEAYDQLVMPFDCGLDHGRVRISPAAERRYAIVGEREKQAITTCHQPQGCRTLTVHRFVISCGGAGVSWMRIAAEIRRLANAPAWIAGDKLHLVLPASNSIAAKQPCLGRPTFALGRTAVAQRVSLVSDCSSGERRGAFEQIVLPAGFAPVAELGARLVLTVPDEVPADSHGAIGARGAASLTPVSAGETLVAKIDSDAIVEPIPGLEPYEPAYEAPATGDDWVTVVRTEQDYGRQTRTPVGDTPGPWAWVLAAMAFATAVGLVRTRIAIASTDSAIAWRTAFAGLGAKGWLGSRSSAIRKFTNAGATIAALLEQTATIVSDLKGAGPLREVLQSELKLVRQRLAAAESAAAEEGENAAAKSGHQFRALVRDLERIRRIARSAAASLSGARQPATLPRTVSEAYDVLGVNADVSEAVLKKIVDALRMSWHPDHARDDEDLRVREDRIRQINIAWELVNAKREAA